MNYKYLLFFITFLCNVSMAQQNITDNSVIIINPVRWGTVVYVKAEKKVKEKLLKEFKLLDENSFESCYLDYDDYENWYCSKNPEMVFQGLGGHGQRRNEIMLCKTNDFFSEYKYFSKEMFIKYNCLISVFDSDSNSYEFHTIKEWFGDDA